MFYNVMAAKSSIGQLIRFLSADLIPWRKYYVMCLMLARKWLFVRVGGCFPGEALV